jgi:mRNA-degrading endonuclease toxin of MazEF toxin-antitoxin module
LADQIKSLDWNKREVSFITKVSENEMEEVINKIIVLITNSD